MSGEKWTTVRKIDAYDYGRWVVCDGVQVARCDARSADENEANAARIVSCVNALRGVPSPEAAVERARKARRHLPTVIHELRAASRRLSDIQLADLLSESLDALSLLRPGEDGDV